jgi:hypothetical protein
MTITPILISGPSLLYPLGEEIISTNIITITWKEPSSVNSLLWIEILFTDNFEYYKNTAWKQIALVPSGLLLYQWKIPATVKGEKCRIGIRAINYNGSKSEISFSAENFTIEYKRLPFPSVIEPITNASYFSFVPIILDKAGLIGRCSQRALYNIYYASESLGIDWTLLRYGVPIDSPPVYWDLKDINSATDYQIKVELSDGGNISEPVFIKNITINSFNYFFIDTVAPTGNIKILNNKGYVKDRDTIIQLSAYDETSGVEFFQIKQLELGLGQNSSSSSASSIEKMTNLSTWHIQGEDGLKLIQARFKDFAGNVLENSSDKTFFRTYNNVDNAEVTSFIKNGTDCWTAFGGDSPTLYKNKTLMATLDNVSTSMTFYDDILYIATTDITSILQKYINGNILTVEDLVDLAEDDSQKADCIVNSMTTFDGKLFLGLQNGLLYVYNGTNTYLANPDDIFETSINKIYGSASCLFIFLENKEQIVTMTKSGNDYIFNELTI